MDIYSRCIVLCNNNDLCLSYIPNKAIYSRHTGKILDCPYTCIPVIVLYKKTPNAKHCNPYRFICHIAVPDDSKFDYTCFEILLKYTFYGR